MTPPPGPPRSVNLIPSRRTDYASTSLLSPLPRFLELPLPLRGISIQVARNKDELLYLVVFDTSSPYLVGMLLHSEIQEEVVSQNVNITYEIEKNAN